MINSELLKILKNNLGNASFQHDETRKFLYSPDSDQRIYFDGRVPVFSKLTEKTEGFDYHSHYLKDAEEFDYFEVRLPGTKHDERRVHEFIFRYIPRNESKILDVGCGSAWLAGRFAPEGRFVCSLDITPKNVNKALEIYPFENHAGVAADCYDLPFKDDSFDCIVASEIIEHLTEPEKFLSELLRCLKQTGKLIITTPYKEKISYSLCIHCNQKTPQNSHLHSFDEAKLKSYLENTRDILFSCKTFGNKALLHLRTHVILRFFPFPLWKLIDNIANLLLNKPAHIIAIYRKK